MCVFDTRLEVNEEVDEIKQAVLSYVEPKRQLYSHRHRHRREREKKNTKRNKNESTKKTMKISRAQTNEKELVHRITQIENDAMSKAIRFAEHRLLTLADQWVFFHCCYNFSPFPFVIFIFMVRNEHIFMELICLWRVCNSITQLC